MSFLCLLFLFRCAGVPLEFALLMMLQARDMLPGAPDHQRGDQHGLRWVEEPSSLRFFFGRLAPTSDWQEKLAAKFRADFGDSL